MVIGMFKKANYVYAVYREGSFTKAAEKLYISQPCLSTAIKQLEQKLGAPLFHRGTAFVTPTQLGLEYIQTAEKILALEESFSARVKELLELKHGSVHIAGSNYVSSYILPRIVDAFSKLYPNVVISLTEANSAELKELLQNEAVDLIVDSFDEVPGDCACVPLLQETILLAVPENFTCNESIQRYSMTPAELFDMQTSQTLPPPISAQHFRDENFILLKNGNSMYTHALQVFDAAGFTPRVSLYLDQLSTSYVLASQGNGCCFVTDTVFRYHRFHDPIRVYQVSDGGNRTLGIACKKGRHLSPAATRLIELASETLFISR